MTQKLSKESIAEKYGVSITSVDRWLKEADISAVRYNESNAQVAAALRDDVSLRHMHKDRMMTCEQIANEIGSSASTVSIFLRRHGIETNLSNMYPRSGGTSKQCQEVADYIQSLGFEVELNNRTILNGYEIDIVVPAAKFCVEFNGLYSHIFRPEAETISARKGPDYHLRKTNGCHDKGFRLLHIFSNDWESKTDIIKSMISSRLGCNLRSAARKLDVRQMAGPERRVFFDNNHLQGDSRATICLGLVDKNGETLAAMSFGKARFNKNVDWELIRYASVKGINVIGGFSKLLKAFSKIHSGSVVTYADLTYSDGEVYKKNGFDLIKTNPPSFRWVDPDCHRSYHRAYFMKKRIAPGDPRPEWEIMAERGYHRIWNCGTLTFIKNNA